MIPYVPRDCKRNGLSVGHSQTKKSQKQLEKAFNERKTPYPTGGDE